MHKRSQGFSPLEIILAIAVIGLIGAVAWMFVNNQKSDTGTKSTDSTVTRKVDETKKGTSASWLKWQPDGKQYSIKFADGWNVYMKQGVEASFYTHGSLELKSGTEAVVSDKRHDANAPLSIEPCKDDTHGGVVLDYMNYTYPAKWYTGNETTIKTNAGLDIKKSVELPGEPSNDAPFASKNTNYSYVLSSTNKSVMISYTACEGGADHHELVEQAVKTFEF